jgi:hypothetical protein
MKNTTATATKTATLIAPALIAPAIGKRKYARSSEAVQSGTASLRYDAELAECLEKIQFTLGVNKSEAFIIAVRQLAASL